VRIRLLALLISTVPLVAAMAQDAPNGGSRITNQGVVRAAATVDSVFLDRTHLVDTVDVGDFAAYLLARLGVPPFEDSLGFRVSADTQRVRFAGRMMDFPADTRAELGVIFSFIDSTAPIIAEVSMPQRANGLMRFRLEKVWVNGFGIPDFLLNPALAEYHRRYPVLSANGREFLVAMPPEATARFIPRGIELRMPRPVRDSVITADGKPGP
jgi:hypothetical protein